MLLKLWMEKRVVEIFCQLFDDDERYHDKVTEVRFHEIHIVCMYHVVFEDNDQPDYWSYELEMEVIKCNCCVQEKVRYVVM